MLKRKQRKKPNEVKVIKPFVIYQFPNISGIKKGKEMFRTTPFISPVFGVSVKDETVVPTHGQGYGDVKKRYDAFRDHPLISEAELLKTNRTKYYEFANIIDNETRRKIFGSDAVIIKRKTDTPPPKKEPTIEVPFIGRREIQKEPAIDDYETKGSPRDQALSSSDFAFDDLVFQDENPIPSAPKLEPRPDTIAHKPREERFERTPEYLKKDTHKVPITEKKKGIYVDYQCPSSTMFKKIPFDKNDRPEWINDQINQINDTLAQFDVQGGVTGFTKGPTVTRYEISLAQGINVRRVTNIEDNLKMNLAAKTIRIQAPIPGKPHVGIEVPNLKAEIVAFGNVVDCREFNDNDSPLRVGLGVDIDGNNIYIDISKMPHGLIAGATNSGKSVCVNTILVSLLLKNKPDQLKLMLIDPKMVELMAYNDLPHLLTPVITDAKIAAASLKWAVQEMERRYSAFLDARVRDIRSYNARAEEENFETMPFIVIVIDELADLMMASSNEVEEAIQRITQKARAAGIHLLVATQRPTTDVVKGTIKSNIPVRIAFKVASFVDSTTILDGAGAEALLGRGDMLLKETEVLVRLQGAYISDTEIDRVTEYIRKQAGPNYAFEHETLQRHADTGLADDDLIYEVARFVVRERTASINRIQKEFNVGFNRAQRLVELLENMQVVTDGQGTKAREVLVSLDELEHLLK